MNKATNVYVFEPSAWLTLIEDEAGVDTVQDPARHPDRHCDRPLSVARSGGQTTAVSDDLIWALQDAV